MPRILVVFGTTEGQTEKIAHALARAMRADGASVDVARADQTPSPDPYGAVIVAASVHAGGYQRSVQRWVRTHAEALDARQTAFVSVCLGVLEHNPQTDQTLRTIREQFIASTGWRPGVTKVVAGALPYTKYNWLKRWMMKRIVQKAGGDTDTSRDYEYTDWEDLCRFATEFLGRLNVTRATATDLLATGDSGPPLEPGAARSGSASATDQHP